jgi:hypothetical protein
MVRKSYLELSKGDSTLIFPAKEIPKLFTAKVTSAVPVRLYTSA